MNTILNVLTLIFLALGGYGLTLVRTGTEAAIKTSAEVAAKATIQQLHWPAELARELQKTRGIERQELRFKSYGALWKELRPLAIYDATPINKKSVGDLSSKLSDWYCSDHGGLLLTPQARDFYFALKDLLRAISQFSEEWETSRPKQSEEDQKQIFREVLRESADEVITMLDYSRLTPLKTGKIKQPSLERSGKKESMLSL